MNKQYTFMTTKSLLVAVALGFFLSLPGLAYAGFKFTTIDVPNSTATKANGNSESQIVGEYDDANGNTHGFIMGKKGSFYKFDVRKALTTTLNGVNENGQYAGIYTDATRFHGFFLSKHAITTLDPPGSIRSQATFLNEKGQVVGAYRDPSEKRHGFIWFKGAYKTLNVPGDHPVLGTVALGINDYGQVVGNYVDAATVNRHGFLLSKGVYKTFDVPGATLTVAEGINNKGQIVGLFLDADGNQHGFVLSKGIYTRIDVPDSTATAVFSINDEGNIVGFYDDVDGISHGFVGKPRHMHQQD